MAGKPATVITGFPGDGRTTLIRHLLQNAQGRRIARNGEALERGLWKPKPNSAGRTLAEIEGR